MTPSIEYKKIDSAYKCPECQIPLYIDRNSATDSHDDFSVVRVDDGLLEHKHNTSVTDIQCPKCFVVWRILMSYDIHSIQLNTEGMTKYDKIIKR